MLIDEGGGIMKKINMTLILLFTLVFSLFISNTQIIYAINQEELDHESILESYTNIDEETEEELNEEVSDPEAVETDELVSGQEADKLVEENKSNDAEDTSAVKTTGTSVESIQSEVSLPYRDGDRGEPIVEMKEKLVQLGFASWSSPSASYGSYTIEAVNSFQDYYGFNDPDIITQEMLDKMNDLLTGSYRDGDRGDHVFALKEDLVRLGFASWNPPTNVYGSVTSGVVKDFQAHYNLPESGIAEANTRAKIEEILTPPYRDGDRGEPIVEMKEKLVQLGFASWSSPSASYGSYTIEAVNSFQDYYGFNDPDIITQEMLDKMDDLLTGSYSDGDHGDHVFALKEDLVRLGFASWNPPTNVYRSVTSGVVKDFQAHYNLPESRIAEANTRAKIEEILTPPYRDGDRGEPIVEMKEKLVELGFATWSSPSEFYGSHTIEAVNKFQDYYGF